MAANQASNQKRKSDGRQQATHFGRQPVPTATEATRDYGSMGEMGEQASDYISRGTSQVREYAIEHSGTTVLIALGAGFGIGLIIGSAIGMPHRRPRGWRDRLTAEGIGQRLLNGVEGLIPDALAEHFSK